MALLEWRSYRAQDPGERKGGRERETQSEGREGGGQVGVLQKFYKYFFLIFVVCFRSSTST